MEKRTINLNGSRLDEKKIDGNWVTTNVRSLGAQGARDTPEEAKRDRERAVQIGQKARGTDTPVHDAKPGQRYEGKVLGVSDRYVVQARGTERGDGVVLHDKKKVSGDLKQLMGKEALVTYPGSGDLAVARKAPEAAKQSIEKSKQHEQKSRGLEK